MDIETKVIDNFLNEKDFHQIKNYFVFNNDIPLNLNRRVVNKADGDVTLGDLPYWYWYATHTFYFGNEIWKDRRDSFEIIKPILRAIGDLGLGYGLIRGKLNFYPYTETVYEHKPHYDFPFPTYGAIFSLNTCDGFTRLSDGTKVDSIENRMLFLDASKNHNSSTTSNSYGRFNINFNFR